MPGDNPGETKKEKVSNLRKTYMPKEITEPTAEELEKEGKPQVEIAHVEVVQTDLFKDYVATSNGDVVFAENTPYEVWESYTVGMLEFTRRSMRVVGQCLLFGERKYGEKYAQVVDAMRYNPKSLANATLVVKNIKVWHDRLSFAHHDIVYALPPKAQEEMLCMAEAEGLTVSKLRKVRNEKYPPKKANKNVSDKKPAKIDLTDEAEVLQAAHMTIAFLEAAEAKEPFRKWPKERIEKWKPILATMVKIARRSIIKTH